MRATFIATALLFSSLAQAQNTEVETYVYGTRLDIASVVSVKISPTPYCEVTDAVMTYRAVSYTHLTLPTIYSV